MDASAPGGRNGRLRRFRRAAWIAAPGGTFTLLDHRQARLAALRGPALVWFVAGGCASCAVSIPAVAGHLDAFRRAETRILVLGMYGAFGQGSRGTAVLAGFGKAAAGKAFTSPAWTWGLASEELAAAAVAGFGYSLLLPFDVAQRVSFANWQYFGPRYAAFTAGFALGLAWLVTLQVHAMRRIARNAAAGSRRGGPAGAVAAAVRLLPSFLCCSPVVPTLVGVLGLPAATRLCTTGTITYFFAVRQDWLLAGRWCCWPPAACGPPGSSFAPGAWQASAARCLLPRARTARRRPRSAPGRSGWMTVSKQRGTRRQSTTAGQAGPRPPIPAGAVPAGCAGVSAARWLWSWPA